MQPTKEPGSKKPRITRKSGSTSSDAQYTYSLPDMRYKDLGGIEELLADIREVIERPLRHPEIYEHLGVSPPVGVLLHGPPGCGKTLLAQAIGGELGRPFFKISAPEIVSGMSGESEAKIRALFDAAMSTAPSIIFIDEIDAIAPKRETAQREMEKRIVAQLLSCMDEISSKAAKNGPVMVIGATNRPHVLDTALRRAGRFDRELALGVPNLGAREKILQVLYEKLRIDGDFDFEKVARLTPGYVGADLAALTKESAVMAIHRIFHSAASDIQSIESTPVPSPGIHAPVAPVNEAGSLESRKVVSDRLRNKSEPLTPEQLAPLSITMDDVLKAIKRVQPSAKREGFATVPNVTWDDVGALKSIREELNLAIVENIKQSSIFKHLGLTDPTGILLYGPPGCGKTLLAKAIANDANANFISVKGPELLNKYVGESERAVRGVFQRARSSAPCIVFFDELDALCPKRSSDSSSSSHSSERVVNQLLTEMDGLEERKNVYIVAATNRPDIIDAAMLRPGRLDKLIYVPLPSPMERKDILITLGKSKPIHSSVEMLTIAKDERCDRFSGADLAALVREASYECLRDVLKNPVAPGETVYIYQHHFDAALSKIGPSVSKNDAIRYDKLRVRFDSFRIKPTTDGD